MMSLRARARKALQKLLQNESGGHDDFFALESVAQGAHDTHLRRARRLVSTQRE